MSKLQAKVIYAKNYVEAEKHLNEELLKLEPKKVRDIKLDTDWAGNEDHYTILIVYETE